MEKRLCTIFLVSVLMLSGCGRNRELQGNYDALSKEYSKLEGEYENLKKSYDELKEKCAQIQDLPDISVTLLDGQDNVIDLTLYSSIQQAQKEKKEYYNVSGYLIYGTTVTIACNIKEKLDDVYLIEDGEIESIMQDVENMDNIYTFTFKHGTRQLYSIAIKMGEKEFYTSIYPTNNM